MVDLRLGDCLVELDSIPAGSVDMVLCDLPYGTTVCSWDIVLPFDKLWSHYWRVLKEDGVVVLFGTEPFTSMMIMSCLEFYRQKLTWLKTRPTNVFNAKKQFMNWTEDIVVFYRRLPTFHPQMRTDGEFTGRKVQRRNHDRSGGVFGQTGERRDYIHEGNGGLFYPRSVLEFSNVHKSSECYHPTQKPVALLEYLLRTYTDPGDVVLDNTMGSGSTGVACVRTGRSFVGIEKDAGYFSVAERRIREAVMVTEPELF